MPRYAVLIVGIICLAGLATWWLVSDNYVDEPKPKAEPTQADRIIQFCTVRANRANPLCSVDPKDPEQVEQAVKDAVERRTDSERIIERLTDDDDDSSDTNIVIPRDNPPSSSAPSPSPEPAPPLVPIEIPEIPNPPDIPIPDLPLIP